MSTEDQTSFELDYNRMIQVDEYTLRNLGAHLAAATHREKLHQLLVKNAAWYRAKQERLGNTSNFTAELELALTLYNDPLLAQEIIEVVQLYAAREVTNSDQSEHSDLEIQFLTALNKDQDALNIILTRNDPLHQLDGLLTFHKGLRKRGELRPQLLEDARVKSAEIHHRVIRVERLYQLACEMLEAKMLLEARELIDEISNVIPSIRRIDYRHKLYILLADIHIYLNQVTKCLDIIKFLLADLQNLQQAAKVGTLNGCSWLLHKVGHRRQARALIKRSQRIAQAVKDEWNQSAAFADIAITLVKCGKVQEAAVFFETYPPKFSSTTTKSDIALILAEQQEYEEALQWARGISETSVRKATLENIACEMLENRISRASEIFHEVSRDKSISNIGDEPERSELYLQLGLKMQLQDTDENINTVKNIENEYLKTSAEKHLIDKLAVDFSNFGDAQAFREAVRIAYDLEDELEQANALSRLAKSVAETGDFQVASNIAATITHIWHRSHAQRTIALIGANNRMYLMSRNLIHLIDDNWQRAEALRELSLALAQAGRFEEAQETANVIEEDWQRAEALRELSLTLAQTGRFEEAQETANVIEEDWQRAEALRELSLTLAQIGRFEEAQQTANAITNDLQKISWLCRYSFTCAKAGNFEETSSAVQRATKAAEDLTDKAVQATAFREIASTLAELNWHDEANFAIDKAKRAAEVIQDDNIRAIAFREIAAILAQLERNDEARQIVDKINIETQYLMGMYKLSEIFAQAGNIEEATATIRKYSEEVDIHSTTLGTIVEVELEKANFKNAFAAMNLHDLSLFLQAIENCGIYFEQVEVGLSLSVRSAAMHIAAWIDHDWEMFV